MIINDTAMLKKMNRALAINGNLYALEDIERELETGHLQGHVEGDTWAITQVHNWPRRKAVNIMYLVGSLGGALKLEYKVEQWAKSVGADLITAVGRDGWEKHRTLGWKKVGNLYSKDI
jgi:hypothetical protein